MIFLRWIVIGKCLGLTVLGSSKSTISSVNTRKLAARSWLYAVSIANSPPIVAGPNVLYCESKITIAIIAISILLLITSPLQADWLIPFELTTHSDGWKMKRMVAAEKENAIISLS